jgi:hypothetical protein
MRDWIECLSVHSGLGEHLPYALALEIHTSLLTLVTFATKLEMIRKVINKEKIPVSALAFYKATHAKLLCHLNAACAGETICLPRVLGFLLGSKRIRTNTNNKRLVEILPLLEEQGPLVTTAGLGATAPTLPPWV